MGKYRNNNNMAGFSFWFRFLPPQFVRVLILLQTKPWLNPQNNPLPLQDRLCKKAKQNRWHLARQWKIRWQWLLLNRQNLPIQRKEIEFNMYYCIAKWLLSFPIASIHNLSYPKGEKVWPPEVAIFASLICKINVFKNSQTT